MKNFQRRGKDVWLEDGEEMENGEEDETEIT
jgi:hypothetical protein